LHLLPSANLAARGIALNNEAYPLLYQKHILTARGLGCRADIRIANRHLADSRHGKNTQLSLADLLRQSVYSRLAGYEDVNDAQRLSHAPTFRLIGSEKIWERGAALTSRLQRICEQNTRVFKSVQTPILAASIMLPAGETRGLLCKRVHQFFPPSEVRYGNLIDRSSGVVLAGWWGLGILSLAQQLAPAGHQKGTRRLLVASLLPRGKQEDCCADQSETNRDQSEGVADGI